MDMVNVNNVRKDKTNDVIPPKTSSSPEPPKEPKLEKPNKKRPKIVLYAVYVLVVIVLMGVAAYFYSRYNDLRINPKAAISKNNQAETNRVVEKLKKVILITETDAPTVARVEEPDKLKTSNPEFYKDIQAGDYLVIYPKRAIIFRESENKIINIAPIINTNNLETDQSTTPDQTMQDTQN